MNIKNNSISNSDDTAKKINYFLEAYEKIFAIECANKFFEENYNYDFMVYCEILEYYMRKTSYFIGIRDASKFEKDIVFLNELNYEAMILWKAYIDINKILKESINSVDPSNINNFKKIKNIIEDIELEESNEKIKRIFGI